MAATQTVRLIVKAAPAAVHRLTAGSFALKGFGRFHLDPLFPLVTEAETDRFYKIAAPRWFVADTRTPAGPGVNLWEVAHRMMDQGLGCENGAICYAEPDLLQSVPSTPPAEPTPGAPLGPGFAWHLLEEYSGLRRAAAESCHGLGVRIGVLDSGYDPTHTLLPANLLPAWGRDFADADPAQSGQGTGALSVLAGNQLEGITDPAQSQPSEYYGGAPLADVMAVRVADSSLSFYSSALARGLNYLLNPDRNDPGRHADVICITIGGVPSAVWVCLVNRAYKMGVVLVAAAGDRPAASPSTTNMVYPARFNRVISVTGAMADHLPYAQIEGDAMKGRFGPPSKTCTLAAYTPNIAWARPGAPAALDLHGAGSASAAPQVAAAAALWLAKNREEKFSQPWQKAEAVRQALTSAARRKDPDLNPYFGYGQLDAVAALAKKPDPASLERTQPDLPTFAFLRALNRLGAGPDETRPSPPRENMFHLELMHLAQNSRALEKIVPDPESPKVTQEQMRRFLAAAAAHPDASTQLRLYLATLYSARFGGRQAYLDDGKTEEPEDPQDPLDPSPPHRRLQGYAFDPSLALDLENEAINRIVFRLPWEPLKPGPIGDYLEVADEYPDGSPRFKPVDLDRPTLLAQDGLPPQQDNPQFHQQMVYAVARKTIEFFEIALGRPIFWSGYGLNPDKPLDEQWQRRIRILPHALAVANAFYSPERKALLFGSFSAKSSDVARQVPGERVFTALSHDIVAHETTHAILDGLHYWLREPTNPDMLAFHEGFADIVALFQHFALQEVLEAQILAKRGDLEVADLLTSLGRQFGQATGKRDALRNGLGTAVPEDYKTKMEPHERGSILVAAVFEAFLMIYKRRALKTISLASAGRGILPQGNLPPVLATALAHAASSSASHVVKMCIRALDYIPPVDLTFGDYLRALITADYEFSPEDQDGYRIAFVDAFRRRGIYPPGLETLTVTGLRWPKLDLGKSSRRLIPILRRLRDFAEATRFARNRERLFKVSKDARNDLGALIPDTLKNMSDKERQEMGKKTGLALDGDVSVHVYQLRVANRIKLDGATKTQIVLGMTQVTERHLDEPNRTKPFQFRGGAVFIVDLEKQQIRYAIVKDATDAKRYEKQRKYLLEDTKGLAYFRNRQFASGLEPFMLLHQDDRSQDGES